MVNGRQAAYLEVLESEGKHEECSGHVILLSGQKSKHLHAVQCNAMRCDGV